MKNLKSLLFIMILSVGVLSGYFYRDVARFLGISRGVGEKGGIVKVSGSCEMKSGGKITLNNDNVRIINETENYIDVVLISEPKYLHCPLSSLYVESFTFMDLFNKRKIQTESSSPTREIERDPIMDNLKKTVLGSGVCEIGKGEVILNRNVVDILDIYEGSKGYVITGLFKLKGKEIKCNSNRFKMTQINESDVDDFLNKERKDIEPVKSNSFKGRNASVTGLCAISYGGKVDKKKLVDVSELTVKVTDEVVENGQIIKISGKSKNNKGELVSLECSKDLDHGLIISEVSDQSEMSGYQQVIEEKKIRVTGKCKNTENSKVIDFDKQEGKASDVKREGDKISSLTMKLKISNEVQSFYCDSKDGARFSEE